MNSNNGLSHSQPASIVLNPGPAGSIVLPLAALGVSSPAQLPFTRWATPTAGAPSDTLPRPRSVCC